MPTKQAPELNDSNWRTHCSEIHLVKLIYYDSSNAKMKLIVGGPKSGKVKVWG